MPIWMWDNEKQGGAGWVTGTVKVWDNEKQGGAGFVNGTVKEWPFTEGQDLISNLTYPVFAGSRFGSNEWNEGTLWAASQLFQSSVLDAMSERILGHCDLRILSDGTSWEKLVISNADTVGGTAVASTNAATWDTRTIASPIGGGTHTASWWENATYSTKSVATTWAQTRVLMPELKVAGALTPFTDWVTAKQAKRMVIPITATYADAATMANPATLDMFVIYKPSTYPGDSGNPSYSSMATDNIYGVLLDTGVVTAGMVTSAHAAGLKVWVGYNTTTTAQRDALLALGVDGIITPSPTAVATTPTPPTPTNKTISFGMTWASGNNGEYNPTEMMNNEGFRKPDFVRYYNGSTLNFDNTVLNQYDTICQSWKPSVSTLPNYNATWRTQAEAEIRNNLPKTKRVFLTIHHEPEGLGSDGSTAQAQWIAGQNNLTDMCRNLRAEGWKVYSMPILCSWLDYWSDGHSFAKWAPTDGSLDVDVMGWDDYPMGNKASDKARICRLKMTADYVRAPFSYTYNATTFKGDNGRNDIFATTLKLADHAKRLGQTLGREVPWTNMEVGLVRGDKVGSQPRPLGSAWLDANGDPTDGGSDTRYYYSLEQRAQWYRDYTQLLYSLPTKYNLPAPLMIDWYFHGGCYVGASHGSAVAACNAAYDLSVPVTWDGGKP